MKEQPLARMLHHSRGFALTTQHGCGSGKQRGVCVTSNQRGGEEHSADHDASHCAVGKPSRVA